jgi:phosphoribosyl-ATP pyrophosphohydrolase/phosphoribosyl-AMP cyclohydrolase
MQPELQAAIVQDARDGRVLMLGWMNDEALRLTRESGEVWFWSRSRQELWHKGATSGNTFAVVEIRDDCDGDALVIRVDPAGPACHTGSTSCFAPALWRTVLERVRDRPAGSYVVRLLDDPALRGEKVAEEAEEVVRAAREESDGRVDEEAADVLFHLAALLHGRDRALAGAFEVLNGRRR